jgi:hypothetical protein
LLITLTVLLLNIIARVFLKEKTTWKKMLLKLKI